jgi:hypothetical protein
MMSNWSDKIVVIGVGISDEDAGKIKEAIVEKVEPRIKCFQCGQRTVFAEIQKGFLCQACSK